MFVLSLIEQHITISHIDLQYTCIHFKNMCLNAISQSHNYMRVWLAHKVFSVPDQSEVLLMPLLSFANSGCMLRITCCSFGRSLLCGLENHRSHNSMCVLLVAHLSPHHVADWLIPALVPPGPEDSALASGLGRD